MRFAMICYFSLVSNIVLRWVNISFSTHLPHFEKLKNWISRYLSCSKSILARIKRAYLKRWIALFRWFGYLEVLFESRPTALKGKRATCKYIYWVDEKLMLDGRDDFVLQSSLLICCFVSFIFRKEVEYQHSASRNIDN